MALNFKKLILLTGAGFTKNFGGFLAREMWSKIFNDPRLNNLAPIKELLRSNFDFETVYSEIINSEHYSSEQKGQFQNIIKKAYEDMDKMLTQYVFTGSDPYGINTYGVNKLLGSFAGTAGETGAHFTLNQDLFMERQTKRQPLGLATLKYKDYLDQIQTGRIDTSRSVQLPGTTFLEEFKTKHLSSTGDLFYIKLHGSFGWGSVHGGDQMVLGTNKYEDIVKEPLLAWYFELFEKALYRQEIKLLIIGYGFKDLHINKILVKAIQEYGIQLYVISPEDPEKFKNRIIGKPSTEGILWTPNEQGAAIWEGVVGYFPHFLREIFPADQSKTHISTDLANIFK